MVTGGYPVGVPVFPGNGFPSSRVISRSDPLLEYDDMNTFQTRIPTLRVRALPSSTNAYGQVQAGWLMGQIDMAGSLVAERLSKGPVTTVAVNAFQFAAPIQVGDTVSLYVDTLRIGQKSLTFKICVLAERLQGEDVMVTEVIVTFVAIDSSGKSRLLTQVD